MPLSVEKLNAAIRPPGGCGLVEFHAFHLRLLAEQYPDCAPDVRSTANIIESVRMGPAFTFMVNGRIGAVFGFVLPWPGLAEAWMIATPAIKPIAVPFTYCSRRFCDSAAIALGLRRIQIHVQTTNETYGDWARAVKFRFEGVCEAYLADGSDVFLMAKIYRRNK